jgi:hypothetical protein
MIPFLDQVVQQVIGLLKVNGHINSPIDKSGRPHSKCLSASWTLSSSFGYNLAWTKSFNATIASLDFLAQLGDKHQDQIVYIGLGWPSDQEIVHRL